MHRRFSISLVALGLLAGQAAGHGLPIRLFGSNGKVLTDKSIYATGEFEELGGLLWTDQPGFGIAHPNDGIDDGTAIGFDIVDRLMYWDGIEVTPTLTTLKIQRPGGSSIEVDDETTFLNGPAVSTYNGTTGWHQHVDYLLPVSAASGAYGIMMQVTGTGYEKSEPILLVFNQGLDESAFENGVLAIAETQFHWPGDANGDGAVTGADYTIWADNFGGPGVFAEGDFNRDGQVTGADYTIWADNFGHVDPRAVPEPASIALTVLAALGALAIKFDRRR